ncbi:MAG: universal stress protein [Sphingomonadales bacterium]
MTAMKHFELDRFQETRAAVNRKFVVVVDNSPECEKAILFASGRAAHTIGGRVSLYRALPKTHGLHWVAAEDMARDEAWAEAEELMTGLAARIYDHVGLYSEIMIDEREPKEGLMDLLNSDEEVFALILGAKSGGNPGPLVEYFSGEVSGDLACPVVIVPGGLEPERIDMMV